MPDPRETIQVPVRGPLPHCMENLQHGAGYGDDGHPDQVFPLFAGRKTAGRKINGYTIDSDKDLMKYFNTKRGNLHAVDHVNISS